MKVYTISQCKWDGSRLDRMFAWDIDSETVYQERMPSEIRKEEYRDLFHPNNYGSKFPARLTFIY